MEAKMSLGLLLAQRIIDLFDEAGATETERYQAVQLATVLIADSVRLSRDSSQSGAELGPANPSGS